MVRRALFLLLLTACLILAARVSERHAWQVDLSAARMNSLSDSARHALDALPDGLEITAFVPDLPVARAQLRQLLAPYLAHSPRVRLSHVDPVEDPELARRQGVTRHGEIHLRSGQRREVLASPDSEGIDRALNRLARQGERWIVSFSGRGERAIDTAPGGLATFVRHIEALGYRVITLDPRQLDALPENTALLLIAGPREAYAAHSEALITRFVDAGGPVLWLLEDPVGDLVTRSFGVEPLPGIVVDASAAQYRLDRPDYAIVTDYPAALLPGFGAGASLLHQARALRWHEGGEWRLSGRLESSPRSWNETGGVRGQVARDPDLGEQAGPLAVGIALEREPGLPGARLVFLGGTQFIGNEQIGRAGNLALAIGLVRWLTANQDLAAPPPAHDLEIRWSPRLAAVLAIGLMGLAPALFLGAGLWLRHRRRRA